MGAYENAVVEEGSRAELVREFLKARAIIAEQRQYKIESERDALRARVAELRVAELEELVRRTLWHADNALLVLPPEMVREFRAALEGK